MDKVKYYIKNCMFIAKKLNPCIIVVMILSLIIIISGLFYNADSHAILGNVTNIDVNAGLFLPIVAVIFAYCVALNINKTTINYNLSIRYSNLASITIIIVFCIIMAIMFGISIFLTHIIAYARFGSVIPFNYYMGFSTVSQGMLAVYLYCLLGSCFGYFFTKLINISYYFAILSVGYAIWLIFSIGKASETDTNFAIKVINFIMLENNLWILTAKVVPISIAIFAVDQIITEKWGAR